MYELEDKDEKAAFYEQGSDRAVAVVCIAIVENRLTDLIATAMDPMRMCSGNCFVQPDQSAASQAKSGWHI